MFVCLNFQGEPGFSGPSGTMGVAGDPGQKGRPGPKVHLLISNSGFSYLSGRTTHQVIIGQEYIMDLMHLCLVLPPTLPLIDCQFVKIVAENSVINCHH